MTATEEVLRQLEVPAIAELFELDYSRLVGNPVGTSASTFFFTSGQGEVANRSLGGVPYAAVPCRLRNVERKGSGPQTRPTFEVSNAGFTITKILDEIVGGDLRGATLRVKTIFARHLDDGEDPDPQRVWDPIQRWIVFRKARDTSDAIEFQLATALDVAVAIPSETVESTICHWTYQKGGLGGAQSRCTWNPGLEGIFLNKQNQVSSQAEDDCALTLAACKLRFGTKKRPLRFGGFPSAGRAIR